MSGSNPSHAGVIDLSDTAKQAAKKVRSAMTDSDTQIRFDRETKPGISNLLTIYSTLTGKTIAELEREYEGRQYGHLKVELGDIVGDMVETFGTRFRELLDDRAELDTILAKGAERAREVAAATLADVYEKSGFVKARV